MTSDETFLVTGSMGCIGSWVIRNLVRDGASVVASDLSTTPTRPRLLMSDEELASVTFTELDVTDADAVRATVADHGVTRIIHLAGLQIPFCQANPTLGAQVNVVGTINVFEAARTLAEQVGGIAYASSLAVMGPAAEYPDRPVTDDVRLAPTTLYGAYKQANEATAKVYWDDWGVGSVGLRPYVVYGVARDQGMTADVAKAILAAAAGRPFEMRFGGDVTLQYANDVARIFIDSALVGHAGAAACNLRNDVVSVPDFLSLLAERAGGHDVTHDDSAVLPYPADLDDSGIRSILASIAHTPIQSAIDESLTMYTDLLERDGIDLGQLGV